MGRTMGVLVITPENCTNRHPVNWPVLFSDEEEFNPIEPARRCERWDNASGSVSVMCLQCEEAARWRSVLSGAITEGQGKLVRRLVNELKCIKCKM